MRIQEEGEIEFGVNSKCVSEKGGQKLKWKGANQVVREGLIGLN